MRMAMLVVSSLVLVGARAEAAPPQVAIVSGGGAIAEFEATSADGCTHTVGELVVLKASKGSELADGVYVTGSQDDLCYGTFGNGFAGYATGNFAVLGLAAAHYQGTLVAPSYSGGADVTLELDLWWIGKGPITTQGGVFHDGSSISFQWSGSRAAKTVGAFDVDGDPATVDSATLVRQTSGSITF